MNDCGICTQQIDDGEEAQCENCLEWFCPDCAGDYAYSPICIECDVD